VAFVDAPLETLLLPIVEGRIAWPHDGALFLRARSGPALTQRPLPGLVCEQTFRPDADALLRDGYRMLEGVDRPFGLVLVLPPRHREEARALMARALLATRPGGVVVAAAANDEGARSGEADLAQLVSRVETHSKNKCRVFWAVRDDRTTDTVLLAAWQALDAVRPIEGGRFVSRPGVFAWDRIDAGSSLLAEHLLYDLTGRAADLGAGFGYLSVELLTRCPGITAVDLYEAEARALELARRNLSAFEARAALSYRWHDVTTGLPDRYDVIVMNPPFHTGGSASRSDVGRRFIEVAASALRPGGTLLLVANRHLAYESALSKGFADVRMLAQAHGYKILLAVARGP
jgi:16S rRNA (guanine1207-N2)-methyltransferase